MMGRPKALGRPLADRTAARDTSYRELGHHESLAVFTLRQLIGGLGEVGDEAALLLALAHPGPNDGRGGAQVRAVTAQIHSAALESIGDRQAPFPARPIII
jgi:hypothetical protein